MLLRLLKKVHMYAGLFTFTALIVYGLSGLVDSSLPAWSERKAPPSTMETVPFESPGDLDDMELAELVYRELDLPLTGPPASYSISRDEGQNLVVRFYTPNGFRNVTVVEQSNQLEIERSHGEIGAFITGMHGATQRYAAPRFLTRAWGYYNEAGLWALGFMALSGFALWIGTRPGLRWAQVAFVFGNATFLAMYWLMR